jgi:hypothetical protein
MRPIRIAGATRYLGAPLEWKDDGRDKSCGYLAIRDERSSIGEQMTSAWELEPDEVDRLAKGAPLYLTICGVGHPPVALKVGRPPDEE